MNKKKIIRKIAAAALILSTVLSGTAFAAETEKGPEEEIAQELLSAMEETEESGAEFTNAAQNSGGTKESESVFEEALVQNAVLTEEIGAETVLVENEEDIPEEEILPEETSVSAVSAETAASRRSLLELYFEVLAHGFENTLPQTLEAVTSKEVYDRAVRSAEHRSAVGDFASSSSWDVCSETEEGCTVDFSYSSSDGQSFEEIHEITFGEEAGQLKILSDREPDAEGEEILDRLSGEQAALSSDGFLTESPNTWKMTGDGATDIIGIALTQAEYPAVPVDHTKYNYWYYGRDQEAAWCAIFISWCADQAGISTDVIKKNCVASGYDLGTMYYNSFGCTPYAFGSEAQVGDIVYIDNTMNNTSNHVGLVYMVDDEYIYTVEGNLSNKVSLLKYSAETGYREDKDTVKILFYARPDYQTKDVFSETRAGNYQTTQENTGLYLSWSTNTEQLAKIPDTGTPLQVLSSSGYGEGCWALAAWNGITGYIPAGTIKKYYPGTLKDCRITVAEAGTADGSPLTPSVTVMNGEILLTEGTDYTLEYKNNVNAGTGYVVITGTGSYKGTITASFQIRPGKTDVYGVTMRRSGLSFRWNRVTEDETYLVYRKEEGGSWKYIGSTRTNAYYDKTAESGKSYSYAVKISAGGMTGASGGAASGSYLASPALTAVENRYGSVRLTWEASSGADVYYIYRKEGQSGTWSMIGSTGKCSYSDPDVENTKVYYYALKAASGELISVSGPAKNTVYVKPVFFTKVINEKTCVIHTVNSSNKKASGYEIQYSLDEEFLRPADFQVKIVDNHFVDQLKGYTYYLRVRAYRTMGGYTFYSAWSAVKTVTVTK